MLSRISACAPALAILAISVSATDAGTHVVRAGETLSSIARRQLGAQARWKEIAELNRMAPPYRLRPGTVLHLPDTVSASLSVASDIPIPISVERVGETSGAVFPHLPHPPGALVLHDVAEAVAVARSLHPEFRALRAEAEAAQAGLHSARLAGRHNPQLEGELGRRQIGAVAAEPAHSTTDYEIAVSREVEIFGQGAARRSVAELEVSRQMFDAAWKEQERIFRIKTAFVRALAARDRLLLLREAERVRRKMAAALAERFDAGDVSGMEASLAEMEHARAMSALTGGDDELQSALSRLAGELGISTDSPLVLDAYFSVPRSPPDGLVRSALNRPDLRRSLLEEEILLATAKRELAEGRPNINVGGGYRREEGVTEIYFARVGIPLPLTNRNAGEAKRLTHEADAAAARAETLRRNILVEVDRESASLSHARKRVAELEPALSRANENLLLIEDAMREGLVSVSEYLFMQSASLDAREEFLDALERANIAAITLEFAAGTEMER